ncbi:MAG TPA: pyridoxal-dependent decarboxylase [Terriglobales bacterium]|nr:pyridoxal-dependent decarboxylase [Terriglobales bacterium]
MSSLQISAEEFRQLSKELLDLACGYLEQMDSRPIFPGAHPELEDLWRAPLTEIGMGKHALAALRSVIEGARVQNGRFFGYVLGSGEPVAALGDLLASVLNQNVTAWRSSPAAVSIERTVVGWLASAIGCAGFTGSLTGGGSSANLMALAMAREKSCPANETGLQSRTPVLYASEEAHMSIGKAVALLGLGRENLRLIATGADFRMLPKELDAAIRKDQAEGRIPIAVVASAGTVNTGSIDPLREIAEIAAGRGLWLHVDGAYGALAAIAVPERFAGLNLADSISLDPHKWLYQPLDCGCLLYRDANAARCAFAHTGDYAKAFSEDPVEGFAFFEESLELSRRFRALKVWLSLRYHGMEAFRAAIRDDLASARRLAAQIRAHPELEMIAEGELSAVCFRYRAAGREDDLNRINAAILKRVVEAGRVYLTNATLSGKFCLRACIVNHRTTEADVDAVVPEVLRAAGMESPSP